MGSLSAAIAKGTCSGTIARLFAELGLLNQQVVSEGAGGTAVADDSTRCRHGIDDDVGTDRNAGDVPAHLHDLTRRLMAQRGLSFPGRNAAAGDVEGVRAADTAGPDLDQDVVRAGDRADNLRHLYGAGAADYHCPHLLGKCH